MSRYQRSIAIFPSGRRKKPAPSSVPETEEVVEFNDQFLLNMGSTVDVSRYASR
jgi:hypothetical protein